MQPPPLLPKAKVTPNQGKAVLVTSSLNKGKLTKSLDFWQHSKIKENIENKKQENKPGKKCKAPAILPTPFEDENETSASGVRPKAMNNTINSEEI